MTLRFAVVRADRRVKWLSSSEALDWLGPLYSVEWRAAKPMPDGYEAAQPRSLFDRLRGWCGWYCA